MAFKCKYNNHSAGRKSKLKYVVLLEVMLVTILESWKMKSKCLEELRGCMVTGAQQQRDPLRIQRASVIFRWQKKKQLLN